MPKHAILKEVWNFYTQIHAVHLKGSGANIVEEAHRSVSLLQTISYSLTEWVNNKFSLNFPLQETGSRRRL